MTKKGVSMEFENRCPECGSDAIGTFRMIDGPIWCEECGFKVEDKRYFNPFYVEKSLNVVTEHVQEEVEC